MNDLPNTLNLKVDVSKSLIVVHIPMTKRLQQNFYGQVGYDWWDNMILVCACDLIPASFEYRAVNVVCTRFSDAEG